MTMEDLAERIDSLARMTASEFSRVNDEFKGVKAEMRAGFKKSDDQFEKVNHRLDVHIAQTAEGFENVDKRFDVLEAGTHRRLTLVENTLKTLVKK